MANEAFMSGFSGGMGAARKKKKSAKPDATATAQPPSFKKGGKVKKTGMAKVHRGEVVLTAREAKGRTKSSKKKHNRKKISSKR